ncbi:MAG: hypothetical protein ISS31_03700 [Kiritimatiellae bacterium]|nr:hypothetical protein [Kiritimatiellia bacterium]
MARRKDIVAIVGAGKGGCMILEMLLRSPSVEVRYVYDSDPEAPGMVLAGKHGVICSTNTTFPELWGNKKISVILEVTGSEAVFRALGGIKAQATSLIGAWGNRLLFDMLASENRMRARLEEYQGKLEELVTQRTKELQHTNVELTNKVTQLAEVNRKIEELSRHKTQYLLRSTHQLKAPFAAIQSYTDLLLGGYAGELPGQAKGVVERIKQRCDTLSTAIHEMLQLASLQTEESSDANMRVQNLNVLLREVVKDHQVLADAAGVTLELRQEARNVRARYCRARMHTLFEVLIKNAIDYSPAGTTVTVSVSRKDRQAVVQVRDRGIGIRPDAKKKIFSEFYRTNEAAAKVSEGSGLGLAIAAEIAQLHGFTIRVRSTVGRGSTFSVSMPVHTQPRKRKA